VGAGRADRRLRCGHRSSASLRPPPVARPAEQRPAEVDIGERHPAHDFARRHGTSAFACLAARQEQQCQARSACSPERLHFMSRRRRWLIVALVLLAGIGWLSWVLWPRQSTFTVSAETTYVTGPLDELGYVDYAAALNERLSRGVTPENNA